MTNCCGKFHLIFSTLSGYQIESNRPESDFCVKLSSSENLKELKEHTYSELKLWSELYAKNDWMYFDNEMLMIKAEYMNRISEENGQILFKTFGKEEDHRMKLKYG
jgi:hypothetical protein